jgi:hypothetical protein
MRHNTLLEDAMEQLFYANMIASPRAQSIDGSKSTLKMLGSFMVPAPPPKSMCAPSSGETCTYWKEDETMER